MLYFIVIKKHSWNKLNTYQATRADKNEKYDPLGKSSSLIGLYILDVEISITMQLNSVLKADMKQKDACDPAFP